MWRSPSSSLGASLFHPCLQGGSEREDHEDVIRPLTLLGWPAVGCPTPSVKTRVDPHACVKMATKVEPVMDSVRGFHGFNRRLSWIPCVRVMDSVRDMQERRGKSNSSGSVSSSGCSNSTSSSRSSFSLVYDMRCMYCMYCTYCMFIYCDNIASVYAEQ